MQIYVHRDNKQLGPFSEAELQALINTGAVTMQDSVWWQGQANWLPLAQTSLAATIKLPPPGLPSSVPGPDAGAGKTSNTALWSMICGISSFFCGITFIPAIVLGHMGLTETKRNPAVQGRGMAIAGLIMGYGVLVLYLVSVIAISILIALGNQVKGTFNTINTQLKAAQSQDSSDSSDSSTNNATSTDSTTNAPPTITP